MDKRSQRTSLLDTIFKAIAAPAEKIETTVKAAASGASGMFGGSFGRKLWDVDIPQELNIKSDGRAVPWRWEDRAKVGWHYFLIYDAVSKPVYISRVAQGHLQ